MTVQSAFPAHVKSVDAKRGIVTTVVSVFNNIDAQNERVLPGAFDETIGEWRDRMAKGQYLPVVYGHQDHPGLILGKAIGLRVTDEGLEVDQQFFLQKEAARDVLQAHEAGVLNGQSFAYNIRSAKRGADGVLDLARLDVVEVGPTIYPANDATRLVGIKAATRLVEINAKGGSGPATDDSEWDGNAAMGACDSAADYRAICAGERSAGDPDERQHWALPHHKTPGGPANAAGVRAARARMDSTEGLVNADAARRHLEAHKLPSEVGGSESPEGKADDQVETKAGRTLSRASLERMHAALDAMEGGIADMREFLASHTNATNDTEGGDKSAEELTRAKADEDRTSSDTESTDPLVEDWEAVLAELEGVDISER